jgi:hypothetical protein
MQNALRLSSPEIRELRCDFKIQVLTNPQSLTTIA